jgi:hypothetical protein
LGVFYSGQLQKNWRSSPIFQPPLFPHLKSCRY